MISFEIKNSITDKLFKCDVANFPTTENLDVPLPSPTGTALFYFKTYGKLANNYASTDYTNVFMNGFANGAEECEHSMYASTIDAGTGRKTVLVGNLSPNDMVIEINLISGGAYGASTGSTF